MKIPHNDELEVSLLGGLLMDPQDWPQVQDFFHDELFYDRRNKIVSQALISIKNDNKTVDVVSVCQWIMSKGLSGVCDQHYVSSLTSKAALNGFMEKVLILNQFWIRRKLILKNHELMNAAELDTCEVFELIGDHEKAINEIMSKITVSRTADAMDCAIELNDHLIKLEKLGHGELIGIDTGFRKLNQITAGFQKTDLVILAGRPGMGKTSLMLNFIQASLRSEKPTLVFSIEMSKLQLYARMSSQITQIPLYNFLKIKMSETDRMKYNQLTYHLSNSPLYIEDKGAMDINFIKAKSRRLKRDKGIELIVIDYLQLINKSKSHKSTNDQVGEITGALKELAKELDVPIIALSQLTRETEKTADKRPGLSHLRDSGSIEQDADMVMFVYRPEYYGITDDGAGNSTIGKGEIIIAKHRNGAIEDILVGFDGKCTNFYDLNESF